MDAYVEIDVSKEMLDITILSVDGKLKHLKHLKVNNDATGHQNLLSEISLPVRTILHETTGNRQHLEQGLAEATISITFTPANEAENHTERRIDQLEILSRAKFSQEQQLLYKSRGASKRQTIVREMEALDQDLDNLFNRLRVAEQECVHPDIIISLKRRALLVEQEKQQLKKQFQKELNGSWNWFD